MRTLFTATLAIALSSGVAYACNASDTQTAQVVEVVEFKLAEGTNESEFLEAVQNLEASFLCNAPGYVSRTLTRSESGLWLDMVHWTSLDEALAAADAIMSDESAIPFMQAIDPASIDMAHWSIVSQTD